MKDEKIHNKICPICGKDFRTKHPYQVTCSRECAAKHRTGRVRAQVEVSCENCNSKFNVYKSKYENQEKFFCSRECSFEWHTGKNHSMYKGEKKLLPNCKICGKQLKDYRSVYCNKHAQQGERGSNYKDGRCINPNFCIDCGKEIKRIDAKRCRKCYHEWQKENSNKGCFKEGEEHIFWNGGSSFEPYSPEFNNIFKEKIRERDLFECKLCGISQEENGRKLSVHHIDYDKNNLKINNLISLCLSCHTKTNHNREYWKRYFQEELAWN